MSIYFTLLSIMVFLLYEGIISSLFYAPKKIKIISVIALILMSFRYIALIILLIVKNQNYLYLLKPVVYTNFLCIPICGILSVFIFARNNKIKLRKILLICAMLCIAYFIVVYKSSADIIISNICGYTITLKLIDYCNVTLLIFNSVFIIKGIGLFNKTYSNKLGALLIIISSSITLISVLLTLINTNFAWLILGDISWILTLNYGLIKLKR
ncbi:hypothetical protein LGK95_04945 [Clostridium algoriphilum]|uniref:hypothetical protein n=1 Tax=Clostridium algoriphilum TaxID=198347 RepID=UPI001CF456DE|nr:hypothetical protein [Clostridium algoriphilum]MCB2292885.1 hypothetical protein [Clostridium algoriphilum]